MPKEQTDKSRYPSRYSLGKFVTAAQYITEFVCETKARNEGKDLPERFWELPDWKKYYGFQVVICNRLLKKYSAKAILAALKQPKAKRIYSLQAPFLIPLIQAEQIKLDREQAMPVVVRNEPTLAATGTIRPRQKTVLDGLDD